MSPTDRQFDVPTTTVVVRRVLAGAVRVDQARCSSHKRVHAESEGDNEVIRRRDRAWLQLRQPGLHFCPTRRRRDSELVDDLFAVPKGSGPQDANPLATDIRRNGHSRGQLAA